MATARTRAAASVGHASYSTSGPEEREEGKVGDRLRARAKFPAFIQKTLEFMNNPETSPERGNGGGLKHDVRFCYERFLEELSGKRRCFMTLLLGRRSISLRTMTTLTKIRTLVPPQIFTARALELSTGLDSDAAQRKIPLR
jgi:hypothetical protein